MSIDNHYSLEIWFYLISNDLLMNKCIILNYTINYVYNCFKIVNLSS